MCTCTRVAVLGVAQGNASSVAVQYEISGAGGGLRHRQPRSGLRMAAEELRRQWATSPSTRTAWRLETVLDNIRSTKPFHQTSFAVLSFLGSLRGGLDIYRLFFVKRGETIQKCLRLFRGPSCLLRAHIVERLVCNTSINGVVLPCPSKMARERLVIGDVGC